jgi:hypothetical protein
MTNFYRLAALVATSAIFAACGGGGSSMSSMPTASNGATLGTLDHGKSVATPVASTQFTLTQACGTFTLTPTSAADASVLFEEKTDNDATPAPGATPAPDNDTQFRFRGAFTTTALTFAVNPASTLVHVIVSDASGKQLTEVKIPVSAVATDATVVCTPPAGATKNAPATGTAPAPAASATPDDHGNDGPGHH